VRWWRCCPGLLRCLFRGVRDRVLAPRRIDHPVWTPLVRGVPVIYALSSVFISSVAKTPHFSEQISFSDTPFSSCDWHPVSTSTSLGPPRHYSEGGAVLESSSR
jgi:hypothetical protein